jgi:hypothetical protein
MGNFLKETFAKVAGNVTQSVVSAVIVFVITTYLLVDSGKKEQPVKTTADTVKYQTLPLRETPSFGKPLQNESRPEGTGSKTMKAKEGVISGPNVQKVIETSGKQPGSQLPVTTVPEKKHEVIQEEHVPARPAPDQSQSSEQASQGVPPQNPVVKKQERATTDTLDQKKPKDQVQKVKKRAEDAFDELDSEAQKQPPH